MKQQMYISKNYLIANTIIGVNNLDGRTIVDDKDIKTVEKLFKENISKKNCEVTFNQNDDESLIEDIFEKDNKKGKVYILLPWSSIDTLKEKYQNDMPFSIVRETFEEVLSNKKLKRNLKNSNLVSDRVAELLEKNVFAKMNRQVTNPKVKEYYVSQR